jgi:hypothetical protein
VQHHEAPGVSFRPSMDKVHAACPSLVSVRSYPDTPCAAQQK